MKSPQNDSTIKQALQALMDADERGVRLDDVIAYLDAQNPGGQIGIIPTQDPKYGISLGRLVNFETGVPIPADEPIFIFRGKDKYARPGVQAYLDILVSEDGQGVRLNHMNAVHSRVMEFEKFAAEHPERMQVPTTTLTQVPPGFKIQLTPKAVRTYIDGLREGKDLAWDVFKKREGHTKVSDAALHIHDILLNKLRDEDRATAQSVAQAQKA